MEELRRIRKDRELTQAQLSVLSNVDPASLSLIETGRRSPSIETLQKLADALGVEVADFFPRAQPDLFTSTPLTLEAMGSKTPDERRRVLGAASDDERRRYWQSIDQQLDSLARYQAREEGYVEEDQATLAKQVEFLKALRAETGPFDVVPPTPDQRAAVGAEARLAV